MWNKIMRIDSNTGSVSKYVFEKDDAVAEMVLYKYPDYKTRTVICCSTQSGCPIGCRFCGAGDKFVRSLTSEEISSQPIKALNDIGLDASQIGKLQIMFMSMGEPMLNFNEVAKSLEYLYGLYPNAALLISTSAPKVDYSKLIEVSTRIPTIGLQFSVHESTDEARNLLIPFKAKLNLKEIAEQGVEWASKTKRRPFFNYCSHSQNTSDADAERLVRLFDPAIWEATISVICERDEQIADANQRQKDLTESFMHKLLERGYSVRMFDPAGQEDIGGGCGQLWWVQNWMKRNSGKVRSSIGHKLPVIHTPR